MPVFPKERRLVTAWSQGGLKAEQEERERIVQEERDRSTRNFQLFEQMLEDCKKEAQEKKQEEIQTLITNEAKELVQEAEQLPMQTFTRIQIEEVSTDEEASECNQSDAVVVQEPATTIDEHEFALEEAQVSLYTTELESETNENAYNKNVTNIEERPLIWQAKNNGIYKELWSMAQEIDQQEEEQEASSSDENADCTEHNSGDA